MIFFAGITSSFWNFLCKMHYKINVSQSILPSDYRSKSFNWHISPSPYLFGSSAPISIHSFRKYFLFLYYLHLSQIRISSKLCLLLFTIEISKLSADRDFNYIYTHTKNKIIKNARRWYIYKTQVCLSHWSFVFIIILFVLWVFELLFKSTYTRTYIYIHIK